MSKILFKSLVNAGTNKILYPDPRKNQINTHMEPNKEC